MDEEKEQKSVSGKLKRESHRSNGFEEWGGYMESKRAKLSEQFNEQKRLDFLEEEEKITDIFKGVAVFVNGYTKPSASELKRLMLIHGGTYHHYYSTAHTTHTIASNLPDSKQRALGTQIVVKPDWIVDSIKMGKLLSHQDYLLYSPEIRDRQHRLHFARLQSGELAPHEESVPDRATTHLDALLSHIEETGEMVGRCNEGTNQNGAHEEGNSACLFEDETTTEGSAGTPEDGSGECLLGEGTPGEEKLSPSAAMRGSDSNPDIEFDLEVEEEAKEAFAEFSEPKSANGNAMKAGHPEFLSEFYGHSRLHHISTAGQELKRYVQSLVEMNPAKSFPAREKMKQLCLGSPAPDSEDVWTRTVMHLDMDCFFVSVGLRSRPDLKGQPVAVTHSRNKQGGPQEGSDPHYEAASYANESKQKISGVILVQERADTSSGAPKISKYSKEYGSLSEIASCSYEARRAGVRNGMFLGEAMRRCPNLKTIPYDFKGYSEVSKMLYDIVASYTLDIEAVSCDELYIECTELLQDTGLSPTDFAKLLRVEIEEKTGCTASAGLGSNMLIARLANRRAKPNGQLYLPESEIENFMKNQKVEDLPGVGYTTSRKLAHLGVATCGDLQALPLTRLQKELGAKTGSALFDRCRGKDARTVQVQKERKSVSAEINYGIRFETEEDIYKFINELSTEVQNRLQNIGCKGKSITLKLMIRRPDAPLQPAKFMGHGICDCVSKSVSLASATSDSGIIGRECRTLARALKIEPHDYRGVGIQVSKLESLQSEVKCCQTLENFLSAPIDKTDIPEVKGLHPKKQKERPKASPLRNNIKDLLSRKTTPVKKIYQEERITADQLDRSVLDALPEDLKKEILETCCTARPSGPTSSSAVKKRPWAATQRGSKRSKGEKNLQPPTIATASAFVKECVPKVSEAPLPKKRATLAGVDDINDIRNLIKEWIHSEEGLMEEDVSEFKGFLLQAVEEDLMKVDLILKCFYRLCLSANASWQQAYSRVLACVQHKMMRTCGFKLEAKSEFPT